MVDKFQPSSKNEIQYRKQQLEVFFIIKSTKEEK